MAAYTVYGASVESRGKKKKRIAINIGLLAYIFTKSGDNLTNNGGGKLILIANSNST